jgi:hypothetical protein
MIPSHKNRWLIFLLVSSIAAFLSYAFTNWFISPQSTVINIAKSSPSGPSIVDASAIVFGLVTGFIIRQMNLITPFGRIHSLICFGILLVIGGLTFLTWPNEVVVRTLILPLIEIVVSIWMIVNAM